MTRRICQVVARILGLVVLPTFILCVLPGCTEEEPGPQAPAVSEVAPVFSRVDAVASRIDFEQVRAGDGGALDPATGVVFFGARVVTSVDGRALAPAAAGLCIRAQLPAPVPPPVTVSVEFYTASGATPTVRLFSASGDEVPATVTRVRAPAEKTFVTATADSPVAAVVFDGGSVADAGAEEGALVRRDPSVRSPAFTIDNLRVGSFVAAGLDVRPGSCPNPFNPTSRGVTRMVLLGAPGFDAPDVDVSSLSVNGMALVPVRAEVRATQAAAGSGCECAHGRPDDIPDLVLTFDTQQLALAAGAAARGEVKTLMLSGTLGDGTPFEASDCVTYVAAGEGGEIAVPHVFFSTVIEGIARPYHSTAVPEDTVGMFHPFAITYHGESDNGPITAYRYQSLSASVTLPGEGVWSEDVSDTIRAFPNTGDDALPSGVFRLGAQCRDVLGQESVIDAARFQQGVAQVVVNFDPDTEIDAVTSYYLKDGSVLERNIDFTDSEPDTVPFRSWINLRYAARDNPRDVIRCSPLNPDRCINFQLRYDRISSRLPGSFGTSGWVPRGAAYDSDTLSAADSNSVNIGTVEYTFLVRGIDENLRPDGTPARVHVIGNYDPTLDSVTFQDHFGNQIDINSAQLDTLTWNWWQGKGYPYALLTDTVDVFDPDLPFVKRFGWTISATGHDHPDDPAGSGVKSWRYLIFDEDNNFWPLARAGETWVAGSSVNHLDDEFQATFRYGSYNPTCPSNSDDRCGDSVFESLPGFVNHDMTIMLTGRDTAVDEGEFDQYMFFNTIAPGAKGKQNFTEKVLINSYPTAVFGRYTEERTFTFHFRMVRDPEPDPAACESVPCP